MRYIYKKFASPDRVSKKPLTLSRTEEGGWGGGGGGGGLLEPAPTLKICNFQTVKAITAKFDDFS